MHSEAMLLHSFCEKWIDTKTMPTRVMLTKRAVLSPLGLGWSTFADRLSQPETAAQRFVPTQAIDDPSIQLTAASLPDFSPADILGRKGLRVLDRNTRMVLACIQLDLASWLDTQNTDHVGLAIGTDFGSYPSLQQFTQTYDREGFRALNPRHFPNLVINSPPSQGNIRFALTTSSTTIANGLNSGIDAVLFAATSIQQGMSTRFICGGSEELSSALCIGLDTQGYISPTAQVLPFGERRDGTLPSEGTALFALEAHHDDLPSNSTELVAWASHFGGKWADEQAPCADTASRTLEDVLRQANWQPEDVDFVSSSAFGSPTKDLAEAQAIQRVFGSCCNKPPILVQGHMWGHAGGATSALQVAGALAAIDAQCIPAAPCTDMADLWLPKEPVTRPLRRGLVLSLDQQGGASALLIERSH